MRKCFLTTEQKLTLIRNYGLILEDTIRPVLDGDANNGNIYDFKLDSKRQNLDLIGGLADKIANDTSELNTVIFARGFGKVTDIEIGLDGLLYILSGQA